VELGAALGVGPGSGEAVADPAVRVAGEALQGEGGAQAIASEVFEPDAVVGGDGAGRVQGEPLELGAERLGSRVLRGFVGGPGGGVPWG